jgi:hypothetical protein
MGSGRGAETSVLSTQRVDVGAEEVEFCANRGKTNSAQKLSTNRIQSMFPLALSLEGRGVLPQQKRQSEQVGILTSGREGLNDS